VTHFGLPNDKRGESDEHTKENGDEGESDGSSRPSVNLSEDDRNGEEEQVEKSVDER